MSKSAALAKNTIILALGKLSSQLVVFILLPLYTHYLSPSEYGFVDLTLVYITLLVPSLTLQLEMASFRLLVDVRGDKLEQSKIISNIILLTLILTTPWVMLLLVIGLLTGIEYTWIILITALSSLYINTALQVTRGIGDNAQYSIASILTGALTIAGSIVFIVVAGLRVEGLLLSIVVANTSGAIYLTAKMKLYRYAKTGLKDPKLQREILGYSTPLVPNGIAWWVINASDRTIISILIDTAANGIYAVSTKYSAILSGIFGVFSMSWAESASIYINEPDRDQFFSKVANSAVRLFGALGLGLIATIPFIFPLMVDDEFKEAYLYIPIMVIGVFFNVIVGIYSAVYIAKKLTKQVMNTSLAAAVLNIALTISLIPFFGLYAAAVSTAVAFLAMAIYRHNDVKKYVKITYEKNIFTILAFLYVAVMYLYYLDLFWANVVGLVVAMVSAYWINRKELARTKQLFMSSLNKNP